MVCPSQTLTNKEYHMLRDSALKIIRALKIEGGCNVQFALDPNSFQYYLIEVNPRVSRSSALASKASGYPIARVSAKIGIGMTLDEIQIANTPASFEPALDYVVTKLPRFPFDKFADANNSLSTQMKATGEVMSIGRTFEESLLKGIRSLEIGAFHIHLRKFDTMSREELLSYIRIGTDDRIYAIAQLFRLGCDVDSIAGQTTIDRFFLRKIRNIVAMEDEIRRHQNDITTLWEAKKHGFSDKEIGMLWKKTETEIYRFRQQNGVKPTYKMIDTCASEFESYIPYFYSTYEEENESRVSDKKKIVVLGSGPIRIGQGVEFDYSTVHAVQTIQKAGYEAIIINNNPETVSTDYTCSDKLYFEPLCPEDVMNIIELEQPEGVIATLGGQTAINLADPLKERGVTIIGTDCDAIDRAENRDLFEKLLLSLHIPQPRGEAVTSIEAGMEAARRIGYPVLVRPSFVLGGRAMQIVGKEKDMHDYLKKIHPGQGSGSGCGLRRGARVRARHHGTGRTDRRPFRRFHQRISFLQPVRKGEGNHTGLYGEAWFGHRHQRAVQHPVHRGRKRTGLYYRSKPTLFPDRPLLIQGHRLQSGGHRHPSYFRGISAGTGYHRTVSERKNPVLCEVPRLLFLQTPGHGCLSFAGNEVHRGSHRLRR